MRQTYQSYQPSGRRGPKESAKKPKKLNRKPMVVCFFLLLAVGALAALWLPLRPTYSEAEKRKLTEFPEFSFSTLANGSYFRGIGDWYADTFPWRETFINADSKIRSFYGFGGDTVSDMPNEPADEIPDAPMATQADEQPDAPAEEDEDVDDSLVQTLAAVLIVDDAGYEYYNFSQKTANQYITAVSRTADALKGTARVFDIVVPTSMDITLSDKVRKGVNTSDQKKAIDYIYKSVSKNCQTVETFDALRAHRKEYVYFRTDHHWTALGAYYAYCEYASKAGIRKAQLNEFTERKFDGFIGAFYNDSGKNKALEKNPDTVIAYEPKSTNDMTFTDKKGKTTKWKIITDVSKWNKGSLYNTFIGGDNPYSYISNPGVTGGSSCVVIKESFGNAFVPFLLANYSEIHIIDYRYWNGKLSDFVKAKGVQDVIYINNISATRNPSLVKKLDGIS